MKQIEPDYFLVNRKLLHSDRWLAEKFTRAQAWVDLIGLAQHTASFFIVRGIKVSVERGQLGYSQLTLAKRWQWSRDKVRRFLKCLENDGDIRQQNNAVTTLITIVKYDVWQGMEIVNDTTDDTTEKHQKNIKQDTYKKEKKEKNDKKEDTTTAPSADGKLVNGIISLFKEVNPSFAILFARQPQRKAVERMLKTYGREKLELMIGSLPQINAKQYWPKSTTPVQLENNIAVYQAKNTEEKNMNKNNPKVEQNKNKVAVII